MRRYETFKTCANLGLVHVPDNCVQPLSDGSSLQHSEYAKAELKFLHVHNGKVDRQHSGPIQTKDIADCIMEVTSALLGDYVQERANLLAQGIVPGAPGGYSGIPHRGNEGGMLGTGGAMGGLGGWDELRQMRRGMNPQTPNRARGMLPSRAKRRGRGGY